MLGHEVGGFLGRLDDPGIEVVELGLVCSAEIEVSHRQIVRMNLIFVQAAHETDLDLGIRSCRLRLLSWLITEVKVEGNNLEPELFILVGLLLAFLLPLVAE